MRRALATTIALAAAVALVAAAGPRTSGPRPPADTHATAAAASPDDAFAAFWDAASVPEALTAATAIEKSGVDVDTAFARLRAGRPYRRDVPRGIVRGVRRSAGMEFPYSLDVPAAYDPAKRYQVRVQLHGGVGRPEPGSRGDGSIGALAGAEQIYVLPQAWAEAPWWSPDQAENLTGILDTVKRTYNVDENHVVLSGVSDGGTGAYYAAMYDTTPYAAFLPLNGFVLVLANRDIGVQGTLFPHNLTNKPWFAVNGGRDPLYPAARVEPVLRQFEGHGLRLTYRPQPDAGHDTRWWPSVKDEYEAWVTAHPREPHPARLTWETNDTISRGRAHWLVIDALGPASTAAPLDDANDRVSGEGPSFGVRTNGMAITAVAPGSNAQTIGLRAGDVVRGINARELPRGLDLTDFLQIFQPGETLTFDVARGKESLTVKGVYAPVLQPRVTPLFLHDAPSGRVDLSRDSNTITAVTRGVAKFTLLLSPDVFDLSTPITVVVDGKTRYSGVVKRSLATLTRWAARDNDRTMLYAAELPISVTP